MLIFLIILVIVAALAVALFLFALFCYRVAFGVRYDKNALLHYFTAEDFSITAENAEIPYGKYKLRGYKYTYGKPSKSELVIFCHGMGAGHIAYTTEIARICREGYAVLAVDNLGCNLSDGKGLRGMYEGANAVMATIDYARGSGYEKIYLVGHSWGGYSALCAAERRGVDKVVAISAPATPVKTLASVFPRPIAAILSPFWYLINLFVFGAKGNSNAALCAKKCKALVLLIHGDGDKTVKPDNAVFYKAEGENIEKLLAAGKAHNPYNTIQAEKGLGELLFNLSRARKMTIDQRKQYFGSVDWVGITAEDCAVMQDICMFLVEGHIKAV